jgi:acyl-CoA reductase-like NAD-dependent aldehyde dehydrogenase
MSRIRKPKASPPKDREAVMLQVRDLLAEHFDVGIAVVSWEDGGETYHMDLKFGNQYAVEALADRTSDILFPMEDDEEEEEEV